ncbi:type II-A CRISPR-associated protein Csn2, partial [Lactobacillus jensenii]
MIISYEGHHPIKVSDGKITFIKVANSAVYRDFILSFQGKSEKVKFFDEHYNQLEKNKSIDWVGDVLITQDYLNSYQNKIISNLFDTLNENQRNKIFNTWRQLSTDIQDII